MTRPGLRLIPLATAWPPQQGELTATVSVGQPLDGLHLAVYACGGVLLELDDDERPIAAYQRADPARSGGAA